MFCLPMSWLAMRTRRHSMLPGNEGLMRGGQRDSPGAGFELHLKQPRGHGGFAVGRELDAVGADEFAHPVQVVVELVSVEHCAGEAEIFVEEIPAERRDLLRATAPVQASPGPC